MQLTKVPNRRYLPSRPTYRVESTPPPQSRIWDVLMVHKKAFFGSLFLCTAIAVLFSFSTTPEFQARGSVELETPPSLSYAGRDGEAMNAVNGPTFDSYLDTQIGILQSDTLIRRVIMRLNLAERMKAYHPQGLVALRDEYASTRAHELTPEEVFEKTRASLVVRQSRLNNLIEVLYSAPEPRLASDFVNTLVDE